MRVLVKCCGFGQRFGLRGLEKPGCGQNRHDLWMGDSVARVQGKGMATSKSHVFRAEEFRSVGITPMQFLT